MNNLSDLLLDEKAIVENVDLAQATKAGQVYCYLSSGSIPMIKIGKGKSARQRMGSWIQEYPPEWRNGEVIFTLDKLNQSTAETALHKFFGAQRVPSEMMRQALGISEWQRMPDGSSEWFYCDTFLKNSFRSAGIDLVSIYKSKRVANTEEEEVTLNRFETWVYTALYHLNRWTRTFMGWTVIFGSTILAVTQWGSWLTLVLLLIGGIYVGSILLPDKH